MHNSIESSCKEIQTGGLDLVQFYKVIELISIIFDLVLISQLAKFYYWSSCPFS